MRATGRVPLTHVHEGSLLSRFLSRLDGLVMRPSSAKPGFAVRGWKEVPRSVPGASVNVPRQGGFRVRIWLQPGEHKKHFIKAMRAPGFRQTRSLAFCRSDQLGDPNALIKCRVVATRGKSITSGRDDDGCYLDLESADPLLSDFGHRETFRRDKVPPTAIWMVSVDVDPDSSSSQKFERDPKPPAGGRYWRLLVWPRWFFLPSLLVTCYSTALWLGAAHFDQETELVDSVVDVTWVAFTAQLTLIVGVYVAFAICHALARCVECCWGSAWTAGTTGCVEDARKMRNGQLP